MPNEPLWSAGRLTSELQQLQHHFEEWKQLHFSRHLEDDKRLNLILSHLEQHTRNHHGRSSTIKQTGGAAILVALAGLVAEVAGLLDLLGGLSLPF